MLTDSVQDHFTFTMYCNSVSSVCFRTDEAGVNTDTKAHAPRLMADDGVIFKDNISLSFIQVSSDTNIKRVNFDCFNSLPQTS